MCSSDLVADDPERRFVLALRDGLPPRVQLTERRQLTWPQRLGALHAQVCVLVAVRGSRPAQLLESRELLLGPGQSSPRDELGMQQVAQSRQMARVVGGVGEHGGRQRSL